MLPHQRDYYCHISFFDDWKLVLLENGLDYVKQKTSKTKVMRSENKTRNRTSCAICKKSHKQKTLSWANENI